MKKLRFVALGIIAALMLALLCACSAQRDGASAPHITMPPMEIPVQTNSPSSDSAATYEPVSEPEDESTTLNTASVVISNTAQLEGHPKAIQEGSRLSYAIKNDIHSCLPWNASSEIWLLRNIYEGLLMAEMNDLDDLKGCIAQSWSHSENYMVWTFDIRRGVYFTDGTVCDAYAIEKSWHHHREASPSTFTSHNISSWEATGEYEFTVYMAAPCAYFETALAGTTLLIVSPPALELYGVNDERACVGTAPYYISEHVGGSHFTLSANPNYYLEEKMPAIETLNFRIFTDETLTLLALINDEIDGATLSNPESYHNLMENGYDGTLIATLSDTAPLWFNAKTVEAFRIYEVRNAICRFIDFEAINDLIYNGYGDNPSSIWAADTPGYVHSDDFYYSPDVGNKLLAGVGLSADDISFTSTIYEDAKEQFIAIQNYLGKQGINMEVSVIDAGTNYTYLQSGDWSITIGAVGYRGASPYLPWTYILRPDASIRHIWCDVYDPGLYQKMLDEYDMMSTAETWDEMLAHCKNITALVQSDFGAVPGIQKPDFLVMSSRIKNAVYYTESHALMCWYLYI